MFTQSLFNTDSGTWQARANTALAALTPASVPLLKFLAQDADVAPTVQEAEAIRAFAEDVVVIGTGGSSLGGKTLYELSAKQSAPRLHFLENVDPAATEALFAGLNWAKSFFVLISKSGNTLETLSQTLLILKNLEARCGKDAIARQCIAVSDPKDSALRQLCAALGIRVLEHEADIGGRFSVLTNVGLLPAAIAGLDIAALRAGAAAYAKNPAALADAAAWQMALMESGKSLHVLMPYSEKLVSFTYWHRQLWAESIGKEGKGTTPVPAIGTVDQHSQIQLYLAGPQDKGFTFLSLKHTPKGEALWPENLPLPAHPELTYLKGKTLGDILHASEQGTIETFKQKGQPVRTLLIDGTSEKTIGALLAHFMLETILSANLLGVNPYDQPAVEDGKILARKYLRGA